MPENFRPISLTSVVCKVMEKILKYHLLNYLSTHQGVSPAQHGFLSRRSTFTQLLDCLDNWTKALDERAGVDVFYLDMAKAFDTVSHPKLLAKLRKIGINGKFAIWIESFLSYRSQAVKIGNCISEVRPVLSGVPQGTVLGPLLFLLFINDLPNVVTNSKLIMYADDAKLFFKVRTEDDAQFLHADILSVIRWAETWQLRLALPKCAILHIGGVYNPNVEFSANNLPIPSVQDIQDLGLLMTGNLKFSSYVDKIVSKAQKRTGLFFKVFKCRDTKFLTSIFCTYIRPLLEYNTPLWSPYQLGDIRKLESVQRLYTRRIPAARHMTYEQRLSFLKLESLELRRLRTDLVETFKILHGIYDSVPPGLFVRDVNGRTRGHAWKLAYPPASHINARNWFFPLRVVPAWNSLPAHIVEAPNVSTFKRRLIGANLGQFLQVASP